ncbi:MAG TPA: 2-C-methyl-D-erythritol 2,4-cyclodiphosphate synthase, partial [Phycisphaerae bacterium]|nr:2-C-methyl-D-erythritol 2,4-cyclodiphosphate synthase [Phycisphaerae bacterium]
MLRTGLGYDSHAFISGDGVMLGGVRIPCEYSFRAHSDGDVVLHALADAMLGALALGDIGEHFPDTDKRWKNADSSILLGHVVKLAQDRGFVPVNIDITIIAQKPQILPHKRQMIENIAYMTYLEQDFVSIKAKTNEHMGFIGRCEG